MKKLLLVSLAFLPLLFSCEKNGAKSLTVTPEEIILYSEGTKQITTNSDAATFTSKDEWYAEVDATGLVTAKRVGKTEIVVTAEGTSKSIPVEVRHQYNLYPDLDGFVGKSKSEVISEFGNSYTEGDNMITYKEYTQYASIGFSFENNKVKYAMVAVPTEYTTKLVNYLVERYAPVTMENDYYYFVNHDKNVCVVATLYSVSVWAVMYMEVDLSSKAGTQSIQNLDLFEGLI